MVSLYSFSISVVLNSFWCVRFGPNLEFWPKCLVLLKLLADARNLPVIDWCISKRNIRNQKILSRKFWIICGKSVKAKEFSPCEVFSQFLSVLPIFLNTVSANLCTCHKMLVIIYILLFKLSIVLTSAFLVCTMTFRRKFSFFSYTFPQKSNDFIPSLNISDVWLHAYAHRDRKKCFHQ